MRRKIAVPLLAAAALAIGIENWLFFYGSGADEPVAASGDESAEAEGEVDGASEEEAQSPRVPPPPGLGVSALAALLESFDARRSPFLPTGAGGSAALGVPKLAGLLIGEERRIAWLGTHARSEGELYEGFTVARIEPARVVLERDGRRVSLWLDEAGASGGGDLEAAPGLDEEKNP